MVEVSVSQNSFRQMYNNLSKQMNDAEIVKLLNDITKEVAQRFLRKVIKRTPVGRYPKGSGKVGGTLRRGWTAENDIHVMKVGNVYKIDVTNPVEYAEYVEYGHRTRNHQGWVEGQFFMTISEKEIQQMAPGLIRKRIEQELQKGFRT